MGLLLGASVQAQDSNRIMALIEDLADGEKAADAVEALVKTGEPAVKHLLGEAIEGRDLATRGWAIVALTEIGGPQVAKAMQALHGNGKQNMLIRTWAAASRIQQAKTVDAVTQLAGLVGSFPAVGRPLSMRIVDAAGGDTSKVETMLMVSYRYPVLSKQMIKPILAGGSGPLIKAMLESKDQQIRRQAAAFLGTLANRGEPIGALVAEVYAFVPGATQPPWEGGPLFLPALGQAAFRGRGRGGRMWGGGGGGSWPKADAVVLTKHLVAWFVWSDRRNRQDLKQQIINNLRSIGLANVTGFRPQGMGSPQWIPPFAQAFGIDAAEKLLEAQGLRGDAKYIDALNRARRVSPR
jgi:hypothetical protein